VKPSAKATFFKRLCKNLQVGFAHELTLRLIAQEVENSTGSRREDARRLPGRRRRPWRWVSEERPQRTAHIALEFGFGNAGLLKIQHVMESACGSLPRHFSRLEWSWCRVVTHTSAGN